MRKKTLRLIISFPTTTAAMKAEKYCTDHGLPGRLIPIPREITAGCGMSWCAPPGSRSLLEEAFSHGGLIISGIYEIMI